MLSRGLGRLREALDRRRDLVAADEGALAGHHFVDDDSEGVLIGCGSDLLAGELLGRHVERCADHGAGVGEVFALEVLVVDRQAKVGDHRSALVAVAAEHDVGALEVAMDDARPVGGLESLDEVHDDRKGLSGAHGTLGADTTRERLAGQEFHGEEQRWNALALVVDQLVAEDVENAADVGMGDLSRQRDLAAEALDRRFLVREPGLDDFEGHRATKLGIQCLVDLARAATCQEAEDPEPPLDHVARREDRPLPIGQTNQAGPSALGPGEESCRLSLDLVLRGDTGAVGLRKRQDL